QYVLLRPHEFIGSVQPVKEVMSVYEENPGMIQREITYVPGLYKIFDSIIVNAADNKVRDPKMNVIKVYIDERQTGDRVTIYNNGKSIPVVEDTVEK
ncbi:hypothetical protein DAPPUDRAFT_16276, partial [Daphnia pulex]